MTEYTLNLYNWSGVTLNGVILLVNYLNSNGVGGSRQTVQQSMPVTDGTDPFVQTFTVTQMNFANLYITQPQGSLPYTIIPNSDNVINVYICNNPDFSSLSTSNARNTYNTSKATPSTSYIVQGTNYMPASSYTFPPSGTIINTTGPALDTLTSVTNVFSSTTTTPSTPTIPATPSTPTDDDSSISIWWWVAGGLLLLFIILAVGYLIFSGSKKKKTRVETSPSVTTETEITQIGGGWW